MFLKELSVKTPEVKMNGPHTQKREANAIYTQCIKKNNSERTRIVVNQNITLSVTIIILKKINGLIN